MKTPADHYFEISFIDEFSRLQTEKMYAVSPSHLVAAVCVCHSIPKSNVQFIKLTEEEI